MICLGCVLPLIAQTSGSGPARAIEQLQKGDPGDAAGILDGELKRMPNDASLWNLLGIARAELHQTAQAREAFERGLKLAPRDSGLLENLVLLYFGERDYPNAERVLAQALTSGSKKPGVGFSYGASLLRTGKDAQGLTLLKQLEPALAESGDYWTERGWAEMRVDTKAADSSFDLALKFFPYDVRALNGAASAAELSNDEERALALLIRARNAAPDDVRTLMHFGSLCLRRDLTVDAINALAEAHRLSPGNNLALFLFARAQIAFQQWQKSFDPFY